MARKTQQRSLKQPEITIIGEGATERFYFTNLRRLKGYRYTCKPRNFTEQSIKTAKMLSFATACHPSSSGSCCTI